MLHILYIIAITSEAMSASLAAGKKKMDWFGVLIIAWITALGGGTIRNVLLDKYPMTWVEHPEYLIITAIAAILTVFIANVMTRLKKLFLFLDAVGLVVFTIIGCQIAEDLSLPLLIVLMAGMITGCAGGIMRDVLCNEIPVIFRKEVYATASLLTGAIYLGVYHFFGDYYYLPTLLAFVIGLTVRICAIVFNWQMPKFVYNEDWE